MNLYFKSIFTLVIIITSTLWGIAQKNPNQKQGNPVYNTHKVFPMVHLGIGAGDYSFSSMGISVFHKMNQKVMMGLSAQYFGENGRGNARLIKWQKIPLTLESVMNLKSYQNDRSALLFVMGLGYSFTLNGGYFDPEDLIQKKVSNGVVFTPGLGYRFNILKNTGVLFDMRYHLIVDKIKNDQKEVLSGKNWSHVLCRMSIFF